LLVVDDRKVARARQRILRRCHEGLTAPALADAFTEALRDVLPFDSWCWHTIDPATLILTGAIRPGFTPEPRFARYEYEVPDVNKFADLARRRRRAGVLSDATRGHLDSSARYRDLLAPRGIRHELRAAFVADGSCWAACALYRTPHEPDFTAPDAAFVASLSDAVAEGFRRSLLLTSLDDDPRGDGPGLVLLDDRDRVQSITPEAERWLDELVDVGGSNPSGDREVLPASVYAVAGRTRAVLEADSGSPSLARLRLQTRSGRWLTLHGSRLGGHTSGLTAVIIEPSHPAEIAPVIVRAYGLTERERGVAQLVLRGRSTRQIANELHLSPHTVQDHLKSIFDKIGVRSRRDLVAHLFADHYAPRLARGDQPVASGFFS
jgi:DNA-binding CsgD family transcriptional regulator